MKDKKKENEYRIKLGLEPNPEIYAKFTKKQVYIGVGIYISLMLASIFLFSEYKTTYNKLTASQQELKILKESNEQWEEKFGLLTSKMQVLKDKIDKLDETDKKVKQIIDVDK
jgi:hypothetical protein